MELNIFVVQLHLLLYLLLTCSTISFKYYQSNKDIQLSKTLSWLLRHGASKEGLKISSEGYISVQEILKHRSFKGKYNLHDIEKVVATNSKQRFKLKLNESTNILEIRANQGHTLPVNDNELLQILEPHYKTVVHGTYIKCWPQISNEGLCRMTRKHIHFAKGTLNDPNVISGLRKDVQIYIFIDLEKALLDGLKFYESDNGVILTEGNDKGFIEPKYFSRVIEVGTGYPSFTQRQDLNRIFSVYGNVKVENLNHRFAVLVYNTEDEAQAAIQDSDKVNIYGEFLTVKQFVPRSEPSTPKRKNLRTKEKGPAEEPRALELRGAFAPQLARLLAAVRLAPDEVAALAALYADLQRVLQQLWPGCVAVPFGSLTTGLGTKSSDADCFINIPQPLRNPNTNYVVRSKRVLQQYPDIFSDIFAIPQANTPIVKLFHVPTKTNCDITFKTLLGSQNSKLIAFLLHSDPRLIPVAVVIKYWARVHEFSGTGKLTNYALTMLIIFYLQQAPVSILPSVDWLQRDAENDVIVDFWNTGFMHYHDQLPKSTNTSSISELLGGFFQYYSTFDFENMVVCPLLGYPIKKELFKDLNLLPQAFGRYVQNIRNRVAGPLRFTTSLCIQDPFELCHNVASIVSARVAAEIITYFKFAAAAYDKEKLDDCRNLFQIILLQKPKLPNEKVRREFTATISSLIIQSITNPDWMSVIRDVTINAFEQVCKIKLNKIEEEKEKNDTRKKNKERYLGVVTKAIWKRKQFSKLYNNMHLNFVEKQTRITDEILNVDKDTYNVNFRLTLSFSRETKHATATIRMLEGDASAFIEFGKFFLSVIQNWLITLMTPHLHLPIKNNAKVTASNVLDKAETKPESVSQTERDNSLPESVSQTECDKSSPEDADVNEDVTQTNASDHDSVKCDAP